MTNKTKAVTVFGFSEAKETDSDYKDAKEVSYLLAKQGFTIINGGGPGIMKASSVGAKEAGGKSIGITFDPKGMTFFEGADISNPADEKIVAPNYMDRILQLLDQGDAYVFFNGGTGTISELGMAWGLARLFFGKHKPLILFGQWWHEIMEAFGRNMKIRPEELEVYKIVDSPQAAFDKIIEMIC